VGSRLPAYCTSMGKVLLAGLPEPERNALLDLVQFQQRGPNTLTERRTLEDALDVVREAGIAVNNEELAYGLRSIAVPVSPVGDLVIRKDLVRFVASLSGPCSRTTSLIPADPGVLVRLEGKGGLAPRTAFQPLTDARSDLAPWLFALALAAATGELFVRRRARDTTSLEPNRSASTEARAA